jgi:hypothetical protein
VAGCLKLLFGLALIGYLLWGIGVMAYGMLRLVFTGR